MKRNRFASSGKNLPKVVDLLFICHMEDDDKFEKSVNH